MNEFIELRNYSYKPERPKNYPTLFLDEFLDQGIIKGIDLNENIVNRIKMTKRITLKKTLEKKEIAELFLYLGEDPYCDRLIVDLILKFFAPPVKETIKENINEIIFKNKYSDEKLYHLLEIAIECRINNLEDRDLALLFEKHKLNLDLLSILLDYLNEFRKMGFKEQLDHLLEDDYPEIIKMQILNVLVNLHSTAAVADFFIKHPWGQLKVFFNDYQDFLKGKDVDKKEGLTILQSMFYGDFEDSGKGDNGGLAILLKSLGDELSKDDRVSLILTLKLTQCFDKAFTNDDKNKHVLVRLPFYLDQLSGNSFIKRELSIKRHLGNFLKKTNLIPDIFHIRYLDNASKAVASLSKELNKKLVFTLTPDPHRNMVDELGKLKLFNFDEGYNKLNKIKIGDELLDQSDGILGIGDEQVKEELQRYFPQLSSKKIKMIGEGIQIDQGEDVKKKLAIGLKAPELKGLDKEFFKRPIILNVGRLAIQKGQIELLKAWANSRLLSNYNLLIIGGDLEMPSKEEKEVIDFFKEYLKIHPHLKTVFFHQGAISNQEIRELEKNIVKKSFAYPHLYLCSSKKEEFGLAILEAMSQGFLVLGPIKGGVKSYLKNRNNGFLIDTSNWESIKDESEKYIYDSKIDQAEFKKIQASGQKTVDDFFSMKKIANDFLSFYLSLEGGENDD